MGVTLCGAALMVLAYPHRRIRFARFHTQAGRIGLDIGSAGNDIATFEKFVQQVRRQIYHGSMGRAGQDSTRRNNP